MVSPQQVQNSIQETLSTAKQAAGKTQSHPYQNLDNQIRQLANMAREGFQAQVKPAYPGLLKKLEAGASLTDEEYRLLRLLIVGEADYYIEHENDLQNWHAELDRLLDQIKTLQDTGLQSIDQYLHLQALCHDATRIIPNLVHFYREQERVERFEEATANGINKESGKILADIIKEMMHSDRM